MSKHVGQLVVCAVALGIVMGASRAEAQGFGGVQRGNHRNGGLSGGTGGGAGSSAAGPSGSGRSGSGGFNVQIGPGGVQFGTGTPTPGAASPNNPQPGSPGNGFNNPNANGWNGNNGNNWNGNNWNNNPNNGNWNNTWNRRPVVVNPAPVIGVPPTFVPSLPAPPAEPILLINPATTQTSVQYRVNQYSYVLAPGQTQQLDGTTAWTIDYHRGGEYGRQSYGLTPGKAYRFAPGPRGWDLFVVQPAAPPTIGP